MGRNKHGGLAAAARRSVKDRHQRAARENITVPRNLVVLPEKNIQSKHKSYFQLFENKDGREKKLEYKVTTDPNPPPGYVFLPSGNPDLTNACKELSREQDAMIFVVSGVNDYNNQAEEDGQKLALQVHRMGHHVRHTILEQAKTQIGKEVAFAETSNWQLPETQEEINAQAEAAMRDLFPRIPNFDKDQIIEHAFKMGLDKHGKPLVGTSNLPLYRRVQLAVLAHIRHVHTRYDQLLKQVEWKVARKAVERQSLDILVKWRGDEETGRDKIGDILREVVVISDADDDSDSDDEDDSEDDEESIGGDSRQVFGAVPASPVQQPIGTSVVPNKWPNNRRGRKARAQQDRVSKPSRAGHSRKNTNSKRDKRGFDRYEAAMNQRWEEAITRSRRAQNPQDSLEAPMQRVPSQNVRRSPSLEIISAVQRNGPMWDDHVRSVSQPFYDGKQWSGHLARPDDNPATNYHRHERPLTHAARPHSGFRPSEGVVVGRRIAPAPRGSGDGQSLRRLPHGELKDFLVPSVEPISPQSRLDAPYSVRRVVREEPMNPEQVPVGPSRQHLPTERRPMELANPSYFMEPASRPTEIAQGRERLVPQREFHHDREFRPSFAAAPREEHRGYFVREARPPEHATTGTTRLVRVHREARPLKMQASEAPRPQDFSPRHLEANGRVTPSSAYAPETRRRVVYTEASASGPDVQSRGSAPGPARPLYYELQRPVQANTWQGSTSESRPQYPIPVLPQDAGGYYESPVRRTVHEGAVPIFRAPAESEYRGHTQQTQHTQHERTPSNHMMQPAAPSEHGRVQYLHERPPPRREVIYIN